MVEAWVSATIKLEDSMYTLALKNANDPKVKALLSMPAGPLSLTIEFVRDRHSSRRANISWLRHAYLALFAVAGYRYIFQSGLGIVRKQIHEPEAEHIPVFLAALPGAHPWAERHIVSVREPEWMRSLAVMIGRYAAFLPSAGDTEFYARLAEKGRTASQQFVGEEIEWPTEPSFGLEASLGYPNA